MTKAVFFDIDGTIYDYSRANALAVEKVKEYCECKLEISALEYEQMIKEAQKTAHSRIGGGAALHNRLIRFQCLLELMEKPLFPHAENLYHCYWNTLISAAEPEPGLLDVFEELKKRGIYVGIGTNMTADIQYRKLDSLGLGPWIDGIVTSEEVGVEKPDKKLFLLCAQKAGVSPQECVFIGDSVKDDILGACHAGMEGVLYQKEDGEREENSAGMYTVIHHFDECIGVLKLI